MNFAILLLLAAVVSNSAFVPRPTISSRRHSSFVVARKESIAGDPAVAEQLTTVAKKLRLQVYDVENGVYGFESKDPLYGIENIHTSVSMDDSGSIGIELVSSFYIIMRSRVRSNYSSAGHEHAFHRDEFVKD